MKFRLAVALCIVSTSSCAADRGRLDLPNFRHLEKQAVDSVDMSFGRLFIAPAIWFLDDDEPEGRDIKAVLRGIESVRIRSYSFDRDYVYSPADLEAVRSQLARGGWSRVLESRRRDTREDVDIYVAMDGDETLGVALIASQPREFTILNVVGEIDVEAVQRLRKQFESERKNGRHDHDADHDETVHEMTSEEERIERPAADKESKTRGNRRRVILASH